MSIITISRGSYSRGREVAEKLAGRLGYECISRDILLEASDEFNIPEIRLIRALHDAPTVLERFHYGKERYLSYLKSALLQHVQKDNVVYHGLAGQYFLKDIPHVIKVRIIADMGDRVQEEMKRENISAEKALYVLKKDDEERRKWGLQVYGTDTWDSRLYDMVLRIKSLSVDDVVGILAQTVHLPTFQATEKSQKMVNDLALACKVQARIVQIAPSITITANDGVISFSNVEGKIAFSANLLSELVNIAQKVDGVKEVINTVRGASEHRDHVNPYHNIG
ncbi:MAG: cytidylate kinase-like family protein [Desulfocapsaceae bacterium]|nr:cytidylate kinase-like family protein [Desulfocapsaceae bacterium]